MPSELRRPPMNGDIADFLTLFDDRFLLVCGDHLGAGQQFTAVFGFERGQFHVKDVIGSQDRCCKGALRGEHRQVEVQPIDSRGRDDTAARTVTDANWQGAGTAAEPIGETNASHGNRSPRDCRRP